MCCQWAWSQAAPLPPLALTQCRCQARAHEGLGLSAVSEWGWGCRWLPQPIPALPTAPAGTIAAAQPGSSTMLGQAVVPGSPAAQAGAVSSTGIGAGAMDLRRPQPHPSTANRLGSCQWAWPQASTPLPQHSTTARPGLWAASGWGVDLSGTRPHPCAAEGPSHMLPAGPSPAWTQPQPAPPPHPAWPWPQPGAAGRW